MKKTLLLIGILVVAFSCTMDENAAVKNDFQQYVKNNFDNPKEVESIIFIGKCDTVTFDTLLIDAKSNMDKYIQEKDYVDSIDEALLNRLQDIIDKNYRVTHFIHTHKNYKCVRTLLDNLETDINITMAKHTKGYSTYDRLEKELNDSAIQYNTFTKQLIRYRVHKGDNYKIDSLFYLTCNSGTPYFRKEDINVLDFGGNASTIVDLVANDLVNDFHVLAERTRLLQEAEIALDVIMELAK